MSKKRGRKKGRLYPQVKERVRKTVRNYPGASTQEVASKARIAWGTADKYLKVLKREKKVNSRQRGNRKIWFD